MYDDLGLEFTEANEIETYTALSTSDLLNELKGQTLQILDC